MTDLIDSLATISEHYDAIFCDLWGCLHNGKAAYPEAIAALYAFKAKGGTVLLLTNSPRPANSVAAQITNLKVPRDCWDAIVSSGDTAQYGLFSGAVGQRIYHIGAPKDLTFFQDIPHDLTPLAAKTRVTLVPLAEAQGVVCTGLFDDTTETPEDYHATLLQMKTNGLTMLCANPDLIVDHDNRRLYCAGALAATYEKMGGTALYFGKPHPPIYDLARHRLTRLTNKDNPRILCIGDGINTDVEGGIAEGLDTLFVTGGIAAYEFGPNANAPDKVKLDAWLAERQQYATYAIPFLR